MRIKIASDIHGAYDALARAVSPEDTLFLLGDYINVIDYKDMSGVMAEFVDEAAIRAVVDLIASDRAAEAKALMKQTAMSIEGFFDKLGVRVNECYRDLFAKLPCRTILINGNVDFPIWLTPHLREHTHYVREFETFDMDGRRVGFINGHPSMNYSFGMPGEIDPAEFARRLDAIGPVDHLFVHCPPAIEELSYDTLARRDEGGNPDLLRYAETHRPRTVHFGHVHVPRMRALTVGETQFINVGPFRDEQTVTVLEWEDGAA